MPQTGTTCPNQALPFIEAVSIQGEPDESTLVSRGLFGGIAATAAAATVGTDAAKAAALPAETSAALDDAPTEFPQYRRRHRRYRRW
ncbi:hypothetical protein [Bosea sp. (in: a-proteobacteria)]|uniref:hypothetical protein n=1 Tax=Bosea sp. (in: a-proteobacteria) TaxID=1871050 RepID=UPI002FC9B694